MAKTHKLSIAVSNNKLTLKRTRAKKKIFVFSIVDKPAHNGNFTEF